MKTNQEKLHVCKLCKKSFLTGNMLGGHMRIHGTRKSSKGHVKFESSNVGSDSYGLREQPKKSWKFSGLNHGDSVSMQETVKCRFCGKEFGSEKSLHGHMRHHSAKERKGVYCEECGRGFLSLKSLSNHKRLHRENFRISSESRASCRPNLVVMALSATGAVNLVRRKRSSRMRYKIASNSSFSSLNESVSGFDIEQQVEEAALALIMMSRCECNGFDSFCQNKRIKRVEDCHILYGNELVKPKKPREDSLDSCDLDSMISMHGCYDDTETGRDEENQVRSEVPKESLLQDTESQSPQLDDESGVEFCGIDIEKGDHDEMITNRTEAESSQDLMSEVGLDCAGLGFEKSIPSNQARFDACNAEMGKESRFQIAVTTSSSDIMQGPSKKGDFTCRICNRKFITYQSLGGHQTFHRKSPIEVKVDSCEKDIQANVSAETEATGKLQCIQELAKQESDEAIVKDCESKDGKEYKCSICFKIFLSGQALGGHKRAHFPRAREEQNIAMKQEVSGICDVLNMNVPYTVSAEASNDVRCESWWPANSHRHEPLVGLIAN
ncbi:hypothetical protein DKX38_005951 [Salix brachista]|uniref:C2H2-type domain-containing protein n=1 Tax=Salix brachista TaxID=2182728 RepID=A0A5N5N0U6_9ROSI|nr:hypothetical protein DKX38_005951 [Salix brachista]